MRNDDINKKEPWLGKIKEKVDNYSEPAPTFGWNQLEKELAATTATPVFFMKKPWAIVAAAAVLIAAISTVGLYLVHTPQVEDMRQVAIEVIEQNPDMLLPIAEPDKPMKIAQAEPLQRNTSSSINATGKKVAKSTSTIDSNEGHIAAIQTEQIQTVNEDTSIDTEIANNEQVENTITDQKQSIEEKQESAQPRKMSRPSSKDKLHLPTSSSQSSKDRKGWSMGAGVSNAGNFADNSNLAYTSELYRVSMTNTEDGVLPIPENHTVVFSEGVPYLLPSDEVVHANHRQPIAVGATFRYPFKHGFSIETGLMFTLLSSDITLASNINQSMKQKLYYLGIPVKANWDFLNKKYVTLYATAGGQIEKSVYGKLGNEKLNVKQVQFSVMGGVGAQFNVSTRLGIYVEPGVAYFFNDGSSVETIRKQHPFNFNMQAGIRFTY